MFKSVVLEGIVLDKLERKIGKYAIKNLTIYLLIAYAIGYLLMFGQQFTGVPYLNYIWFEPYLVLKGQIWRLFTWVLIPPKGNIVVAVIMFILYYQLGTALERAWGAFRFNVYIFGGMLFTIIGAFITYFICVFSDSLNFRNFVRLSSLKILL